MESKKEDQRNSKGLSSASDSQSANRGTTCTATDRQIECSKFCFSENAKGSSKLKDGSSPNSTCPDRQIDCRTILKSLTLKHPKNLVLVVGAGVSSAAAPTVEALYSFRSGLMAVLDAAEELQVLHSMTISDFRARVKRDRDVLALAHELIREMSPSSGELKPSFYRDCLLKVYDKLERCITCPMILETILTLMDKGALVISTNYDTFLEKLGLSQARPMESIDMQDTTKLLNWAKGQRKFSILHIHGVYANPTGIAWDKTQYNQLAQNAEFMEALHLLFFNKTFVFLGIGNTLRDQVFQALFWHTTERSNEMEHYMMVQKKDEDAFFQLQKEMLLVGIKLMAYGGCFSEFPAYLKHVSALVAQDKKSGMCGVECPKRKLDKCECEHHKKRKHCEDDIKRKSLKDTFKKPSQTYEADDHGVCQL